MPTNTTAIGVGAIKRLQVVIKSTAGAATNSDMTLVINPPSGSAVVLAATSTGSTAINHTATGTWQYDLNTTGAGDYTYQWYSTGTVNTSTGGRFAVYPRKASS